MAQSSLSSSVESLRASVSLLSSSISILQDGVQDFPRLTHVLQTTRHFEVTTESRINAAQASIRAEIEPQVDRLFELVESHLDRLARKEESLIARKELLEGRGMTTSMTTTPTTKRSVVIVTGDRAKMDERWRSLQQKKERLAFAVERLSLQARQKERQLRKSMAVVGMSDV